MPGERIVGISSHGKGLTVHAIDCPELAKYEDREELWRDLQWTPEAERDTISATRLHATILDAPGVLGQACAIIGEAGGNIIGLSMHHRHSSFFDADIDIEVKDARHLTADRRGAAGLPVGRNGGAGAGLAAAAGSIHVIRLLPRSAGTNVAAHRCAASLALVAGPAGVVVVVVAPSDDTIFDPASPGQRPASLPLW